MEANEKAAGVPAKAMKKKRGVWRIVRIGFLSLAGLLVGGAVVARAMAPGLIRTKAEEIGSAALGVPLTIEDVSLRLLGGGVDISGVRIANPQGFGPAPLFSLGGVTVNVSVSDLLDKRIVVQDVTVRSPHASIEKNAQGALNYVAIRENVERWQREQEAKKPASAPAPTATGDGTASGAPQAPPPYIELQKLTITDVAIALVDRSAAPERTLAIRQAVHTLTNVVLDPASKAPAWATYTLDGFAIEATGPEFPDKQLVAFEKLTVEADVPGAKAGKPHVRLVRLEKPVLRHAQVTDDISSGKAAGNLAKAFAPPAPKAEANAETAVSSDAAAPEETPGAAAESDAPAKPFALDQLEILGGALYQRDLTSETPKEIAVTALNVDIRDYATPANPAKPVQVTLRCAPFAEDAHVTVKVLDTMAATMKDRDTTFDVEIKNFPVHEVPGIDKGRVQVRSAFANVKTKGTLKQQRLNADVTVQADKLDISAKSEGGAAGFFKGAGLNAALSSVGLLKVVGTNNTVPISFNVSKDLSGETNWRRATWDIMTTSGDALLSAVTSAATQNVAAIGGAVGDAAVGAAGAVGDAVGSTVDVAGDAAGAVVDGVGGAVGAIGDGIGNLFGGKKDPTPAPSPTPEP